jgi:hypothetical protein
MTTRVYTDDELNELRSMHKSVTNPKARWSRKPKINPVYSQRGFHLFGLQDETARFHVYQRQNLSDRNDFSCGIAYLVQGVPPLTLARYNGPSHRHGDIFYRPHVHRASERAMASGRRPDSEADETDGFTTVEDALALLIRDFNVSGIEVSHDDQLALFP